MWDCHAFLMNSADGSTVEATGVHALDGNFSLHQGAALQQQYKISPCITSTNVYI